MKKKLLSILLVLCMAATLLPGTALAAEFNDVDGHWGQEAIERWAGYGVLNGKGDGVFDPNGVMTRAEFATMLVNMMGYTKTSTDTFSDLNPGAWYADAMSKLVAAGVMNGVGGGRIDPMGQITREQAAVMLCRAFGIKASSTGTIAFQDSAKVSSWARDAMTALSERGMINGVGNNILSPDGIVNRATAAKLTSNMVAEYVTTDKVLSGEITGVVIVAKGAKVEIKDATVTAPIVVESASVSLTNTKAEEVKVAGEKAAVTADKDSTVTDVSIGGEAPAVELNGKVEGTVTVEEGATAPEIKGDGVKADQVVNNTDADVTVNGETVKPEDKPETPSTSDSGSGSGGNKKPTETDPVPETPEEHTHTYAWAYDTAQHWKVCSCGDIDTDHPKTNHDMGAGHTCTANCGYALESEDGDAPLEHTHNYAKVEDGGEAATCTEAGYELWKCTGEDANGTDPAQECTATEKHPISALGHDWDAGEQTEAPTCIKVGKKVFTCQRTNGGTKCTEKRTEDIAPNPEAHVLDGVDYTLSKTDKTKHVKICTECKKETNAADHTFAGAYTKDTATKHTQNCSDCSAKETNDCTFVLDSDATSETKLVYKCKDNCGNTKEERHTEHAYNQEGDKCICGKTKPVETPEHEHQWQDASDTNKEGWVSDNKGNHTRTCTANDCTLTDKKETGSCDEGGTDGACSKCGYKAQPANPHADHDITENKEAVPATCTTGGHTAGKYCNTCNEWLSGTATEPDTTNGHDFANGTVVEAAKTANCVEKATTEKKQCKNCTATTGGEETGEVDPNTHKGTAGNGKDGTGCEHCNPADEIA